MVDHLIPETKKEPSIPAIVVTGPVGSGKSTTIDAISEILSLRSVRHVAIDMDYLRWVSPHPEGDRFGMRLGFRNLSAIWPNMVATGIRCAILADVVESREQIAEYRLAMLGTDVTIVRLDVPMIEIERRLHGRETEKSIAWYLRRAPELQSIMEQQGIGDMVIDVGSRSPEDVATEIIERTSLYSR